MRSIMQDIHSEFRRFIVSRAENLLIVPCEADHSALLFKALEALEDDSESLDIFLTFGHPFTDPGQYVREIPPIISLQLTGVNQELVKRGELALPTPADERTDAAQKTSSRRVGLMRYV